VFFVAAAGYIICASQRENSFATAAFQLVFGYLHIKEVLKDVFV
jgi:hypothetical protein